MNNLIDKARRIPIGDATTTISLSPLTLAAPARGLPLELRITAPATGRDLPVILLSHGHGPSRYLPSKDGYGPLVNFYAEHGFVVIQPTHANSKVAGFASDAPGAPLFWRARVNDMKLILDRLDEIGAMVQRSPAVLTMTGSPPLATRWVARPSACCLALGSPIPRMRPPVT